MKKLSGHKARTSPISLSSLCTYELRKDRVIVRLFGVVPIRTIHLSEIYYLRPATLEELAIGPLQLNAMKYLPKWKTIHPMYVVQTKTKRIVMNLQKGTHFAINQAIERHKISRRQALAA